MTKAGVASFEVQSANLRQVVGSLTPEEWDMASGADGWTVHDTVAHMSALLNAPLHLRELLKTLRTDDIEASNNGPVEARRTLSSSELLTEYDRGLKWARRLGRICQAPLYRAIPLPMGNLGVHPQHFLPDTMAFDHHVHLRYDICAPYGPIERTISDVTADELVPILGWMVQIIPPTADDPAVRFEGWVDLVVVGPIEYRYSIRATTSGLETRTGPAPGGVATITSSVEEFILWATHRRSWRDCNVKIEGNNDSAEALLDVIHPV